MNVEKAGEAQAAPPQPAVRPSRQKQPDPVAAPPPPAVKQIGDGAHIPVLAEGKGVAASLFDDLPELPGGEPDPSVLDRVSKMKQAEKLALAGKSTDADELAALAEDAITWRMPLPGGGEPQEVLNALARNPAIGKALDKLPAQALPGICRRLEDPAILKQVCTRTTLPAEARLAAAGNEETPQDIALATFKELLESKEPSDRVALARQPRALKLLPAEALERLANDEDEGVRAAFARNPAVADRLNKLSPEANRLVARFTMDERALQKCALSKDPITRGYAAGNGYAPALLDKQTLMKLAQDEDDDVRQELAENRGMADPWLKDKLADVLTRLVGEQEKPAVRCAAAANPNTPALLLERLCDQELARLEQSDKERAQRPKPAKPEQVPDEDDAPQRKIGKRQPRPVQGDAGKQKRPPQPVDNSSLLLALATNDALPPAKAERILTRMTADEDDDIRWSAMHNPRLPAAALAQCPVGQRLRLARDPETPPALLARLVEREADEDVLLAVVNQSGADADTAKAALAKLAAPTFSQETREWVAGYGQTPPEALAQLSRDSAPAVRLAVAGNDQTPEEDLRRLMDPRQEQDQKVRMAAAKTLAERQAAPK